MGDSLGALLAPFKNSGVKMRRAANFLQRNKIKELAADGKSSKYIAKALNMDEGIVSNFMPPKPKKKAEEVEVPNDAA